jgi:ABC-type siderophore export system fused ATPase/permease subunit
LVGHNGAGKTTLIRLILGLIRPTSGQMLVDGLQLDDEKLRQYRKGYSAVLADFHLFDHVDDSTDDQKTLIEHWLEQLGLADKISFEHGVFSSTDLSTGQRKRLAMVSAIAENRRVMILDEWAADQDPVFREKFYRELLPALKGIGYTLFVVSHDDRFFDIADRIIHLEGGHIHEPL